MVSKSDRFMADLTYPARDCFLLSMRFGHIPEQYPSRSDSWLIEKSQTTKMSKKGSGGAQRNPSTQTAKRADTKKTSVMAKGDQATDAMDLVLGNSLLPLDDPNLPSPPSQPFCAAVAANLPQKGPPQLDSVGNRKPLKPSLPRVPSGLKDNAGKPDSPPAASAAAMKSKTVKLRQLRAAAPAGAGAEDFLESNRDRAPEPVAAAENQRSSDNRDWFTGEMVATPSVSWTTEKKAKNSPELVQFFAEKALMELISMASVAGDQEELN